MLFYCWAPWSLCYFQSRPPLLPCHRCNTGVSINCKLERSKARKADVLICKKTGKPLVSKLKEIKYAGQKISLCRNIVEHYCSGYPK